MLNNANVHTHPDDCFQVVIADIRQRHTEDDVSNALDNLLQALWCCGEGVFVTELHAMLDGLRDTSNDTGNDTGIPASGFIYDPD